MRDKPAALDGLVFPLASSGDVSESEGPSSGDSAPTDENPPGAAASRAFRDSNDVTGDERAALARPADDDLTGVHADAERQALFPGSLEAPPHGQCRVQSALGVVLVREWGAKCRHDGIADEFFEDMPAQISDAIAS